MRKRDFGVLLISVFCVFISLQHEGTFSFKEAWYHPLDEESNPLRHEVDNLPPPVVIDLNGDGRREVVIATHDAKLQVLEPTPPHTAEPFRDAPVLTEVDMRPANVRMTAGRQPVALAAGYLDEPTTGRGRRVARKAVIVVVTAGWSILCYDHNLKLLWENNVQVDFPHGAHHKEVAILITNQTMHHGDRGVVIVGGSMEILPQRFKDPFGEEEEAEEESERHRRAAPKSEKLEDVSGDMAGLKERHFSYYAYNGGDGELRWQHDSKKFHRDGPALSERLHPQHNYKLDAGALASRHYGEVACREYRESVLGAMPHSWDRREDTSFSLRHFRKHRRRPHKRQQGKRHASHGAPPHLTAGRDKRNPVAHAVGKAIHLASSNKIKTPDPAHGNLSDHWWAPNAIVAHFKEGIEAVHLYSGRTICKLHLKPGGLHADVNGDGVLDHVQVSGSVAGELLVAAGSHEPLKPCWAVATSGVPVAELLFNGSVCRPKGGSLLHQADFSRAFGRTAEEEPPLEFATPILLPRYDGHRHRKGSHGDIVFLNSLGDVTSYEAEALKVHRGKLRWQITTEASWENQHTRSGILSEKVVPTLKAISFRAGGQPNAILAVGESMGVLLSRNGYKETSFIIPVAPVAPVIVADFDGDGWNDLMVLSSHGVYAYFQVRQPGIALFSALLGFLVVGMSVLFVTQTFTPAKSKKDRRSTD